jgi:hypothetical protein
MKFSEVIAALEDGKKVTREGDPDGVYVQLVVPADTGLQPRLIEVYPDGSWVRVNLKFDGSMREAWRVIE